MENAKFISPPKEAYAEMDPDSAHVFCTPQRDGCKRPNHSPAVMDSFRTPGGAFRKRSGGKSAGTPTALAIPASPFMQKLGYGTGVNVYLMKRSPRGHLQSPWAVKKISRLCTPFQQTLYQKRLYEEASVLKNLQHPNIVGYRAYTKANDGTMCLAMEYGGATSLYDLIEARNENEEGPFPAETILKVALNMARGLKYLHNERKVLHGDIKSSNVVIKGDFETIKICDVGVCLPLNDHMIVSNPTAQYIGTEPWKPKESLHADGIITDKSDIYPFGLTLWEMMTLAMPHLNLPVEEDDESFSEEDFDDIAYWDALGTRPPLNIEELGESYQKVIELFSVCTNEDPNKRPSAAHIVAVLETEWELVQ